MVNQRSDVWEKRWSAMNRILETGNDSTGSPAADYPRQATLQSLRICLQSFGRTHFDFFKQGLEGKGVIYLEPSTEYPKEYVLSTILQQVACDLDVVTRAMHQRMATAIPAMGELLNKADRLAYAALEPAIEKHLLPNTTVITYFQKSTSVRLTPYAPVALIGIPFSTIDNPNDLLAIPHEIGHYVYRHGVVQSAQHGGGRFEAMLRKELAWHPQWLMNWVEEIFADVYGCIVAGPVIALSFQDMQADWSQQDFCKDDGEHPVGSVRPAVYAQVMDDIPFGNEAAKALAANWKKQLAARRAQKDFTPADGSASVELDYATGAMAEVVKTIMNQYLKKLIDPDRLGPDNPKALWQWDELNDGERVDQLYSKFTKRVDALDDDMTAFEPELQLKKDENGEDWVRLDVREPMAGVKPVERKAGETGLWIDALKATKESGQPLTMPPEIWTALLNSNGWATEGPGGNAH